MNQKYNGELVGLSLKDAKSEKEAGSIVMINELGDYSHITVRTLIKSALSKNVLEKYSSGTMTFNLQDIDDKAKQNPTITVQKLGESQVQVIGWYCYAIDPM